MRTYDPTRTRDWELPEEAQDPAAAAALVIADMRRERHGAALADVWAKPNRYKHPKRHTRSAVPNGVTLDDEARWDEQGRLMERVRRGDPDAVKEMAATLKGWILVGPAGVSSAKSGQVYAQSGESISWPASSK